MSFTFGNNNMMIHLLVIVAGLILPSITIEHDFVIEVVPILDEVAPIEPPVGKIEAEDIEKAVLKAYEKARKEAEAKKKASTKKKN